MKYDFVISGGGTAGCACAYTAAKLDKKVLLVEKNSYLGGSMTASLVTPAMGINTDKKLNLDFYELLMKILHEKNAQITYSDGNIGWFNPFIMKDVLLEILKEAGVTIIFNAQIKDIIHDNSSIKSIRLEETNDKNTINIESKYADNINLKDTMLSEYIETMYLVDGTGNGKIFEKLNLKFLNNIEKNKNNFQPTNLRFVMSGINIKEFSDWIMDIDPDRNVTTAATIDGQIHLSTAYTWDKGGKWALRPIFKKGIEEGYITEADSNYFQLFTIPGMPDAIAFNCPRLLESIDITDKTAVDIAIKQGTEAIERIANFLKHKFKGFENAYIYKVADALGIRVSNRIRGKYIYSIQDLQTGKKFENPVLISKYPVDIHSNSKDSSILQHQEQEYMLPVESLISADYDNLFAIGRCLSADFMAQAALRIIPSCFAMGEGLAKYLSKNA